MNLSKVLTAAAIALPIGIFYGMNRENIHDAVSNYFNPCSRANAGTVDINSSHSELVVAGHCDSSARGGMNRGVKEISDGIANAPTGLERN